MTREELRQDQLDNEDQLRTELGGLVWKRLSKKQQALAICNRNLMSSPTAEEAGVVNAFLDVLVARISNYSGRKEA